MLLSSLLRHRVLRTAASVFLTSSLATGVFGAMNVGTSSAATDPDVAVKAASQWRLTSSTTLSGPSAAIEATFVAPLSGTFVLNLEIWNSAKTKNAQKSETQTLVAGQAVSLHLDIVAGSLAAGEYSVRQGVWTKAWGAKLAGVWFTGSFVLPTSSTTTPPTSPPTTTSPTTTPPTTVAPATTVPTQPTSVWKLSSTKVKTASAYEIVGSFQSPTSGTYVIDLEIWDAYGKKFQTKGKATVAANGVARLTNVIPLTDTAPGAYTVRLGVWTSDWSQKLAGVIKTDSFVVAPVLTSGPSNPDVGDPLDGVDFYGPNAGAVAQSTTWATSRPADAAVMKRLGDTATATWFSGGDSDVATAVQRATDAAAAVGKVPVLVAYNITDRDCGSHSAGGAKTEALYAAWVHDFATVVGNRKAVVIIEPDALSQFCGNPVESALRLREIRKAVDEFTALPNTVVYLDAGHAKWITPSVMADRLKLVGIEKVRGFAVNVAAYATNADSTAYGLAISAAVGNKRFVIDTSRNGAGSNGEWCNPMGRSLGLSPTSSTDNPTVDAYVWIKTPGVSDGPCNGGPAAGKFWADYALGMARRAGW